MEDKPNEKQSKKKKSKGKEVKQIPEDILAPIGTEQDGIDIPVTTTHAQRFASCLETGYGSDITLLAGKDKIPMDAHKVILMIGSPVIRQLLTSDPDIKTLEMPSLEHGELMTILKKPGNMDAAFSVLQSAKDYGIPELGDHCGKLLESKLTNDSAIPLYHEACRFQNDHLQKVAMSHICKNAAQVVESKHFANLPLEMMEKLLEKDSLAVYDEIQLFEAMMRWAHAETERQGMALTSKYLRSVLEKLLHLIRYPQMLPSDFSLKVATAQVLTTEEILSVLLYFNVPLGQRHSMTPGLFNPRPRQYFSPIGQLYIQKRLHPVDSPANWNVNPQPGIPMTTSTHSIKFRVDTQIWINSIGVNAVSQNRKDFSTNFSKFKIKIREPMEKTLAKKTVNLSWVNSLHTPQHITFDAPVRIMKDTWYSASFRIISGIYVGRRYEVKAVDGGNILDHICSGQKKVNFQFANLEGLSEESTDTTQGYLPEIGFYVD